MDWEDLRHFAAFVQAGSLSGAARLVGVEHATVARRILALEQRLSLSLVDRRGRRLTLTEDGQRIAALAAEVEQRVHSLERAAEGARSDMTGTVTLSLPPALTVRTLIGPLTALQQRHRGLLLRVLGEERSASLDRREADLAVRLSRPEDGELTISKIGQMAFRLYGSHDYLSKTAPSAWRFIGFHTPDGPAPQQVALEHVASGREMVLMANSVEIQLAATRAGAGLAALPDFMARDDPTLIPVPGYPVLVQRDVWLVVHSALRHAPLVRLVQQCLREALVDLDD